MRTATQVALFKEKSKRYLRALFIMQKKPDNRIAEKPEGMNDDAYQALVKKEAENSKCLQEFVAEGLMKDIDFDEKKRGRYLKTHAKYTAEFALAEQAYAVRPVCKSTQSIVLDTALLGVGYVGVYG